MSDEKGQNKRIIKKPKKGAITMNIKVSTQDKDMISKNNITSEKNKNQKSSSAKYIAIKEEFNIFHQTSILSEELKTLNSKINYTAENDVKILDSLNFQISELEKEQNMISKKNSKLMSKLKEIEKNISKRFSSSFKVIKLLSNQKKLDSEVNINTQIKSKEGQIETEQKYIEYNKKEVEKLKNLSKEGMEENLNKKLKDLNEKIQNIENEIEILNKIKNEHLLCEKSISKLKIKINVLSNNIELEKKMKNTEIKKKKKQKAIKTITASMNFSEKVRKKLFSETKEKYSSKSNIFKNRLFNILLNEIDEKNGNNPKSSRGNNEQIKTITSIENLKPFLSYLKNGVKARTDSSTPKNFLFSEKEKEVLNKYIPGEYVNNLNQKYKDIENKINEIEKGANQKKEKIINKLDTKKVNLDETNLKIKELTKEIITKKSIISKNQRKISYLKDEIKKLEQLINEEEKKILMGNKKSNDVKKIIDELIQKKNKEKKEEEKNIKKSI